jgi:hypothetical protein
MNLVETLRGLIRMIPFFGGGDQWSWLRGEDEMALQERMTALFREAAVLGEGQRRQRLRPLIDAEYSLPDGTLRRVTIARLRSYVTLENEAAHRVADSYDAIINNMPGDIAFRRASFEQQEARSNFSVEEEEKLHSILPNVFGDKPAELQIAEPRAREGGGDPLDEPSRPERP